MNALIQSVITAAYLMWVGKDSYPTIQDWVSEVLAQGVSKRLPNANSAKPLTEPGAVVFVAHDEGVYHECPECVGTIECPECRLRKAAIDRLDVEIDKLSCEMDALLSAISTGKVLTAEKAAKLDKVERSIDLRIANRVKKIAEKEQEIEKCADCNGTLEINGGTGGAVTFNNGVEMDYRKYNYYLHQPNRWTADSEQGVKDITMCERCGGTGRLPEGYVFGLFVPNAVEYVLRPEDNEAVKKRMESGGFKTVGTRQVAIEVKRRCGLRKHGGMYVVTNADADDKNAKAVADELVEKGLIDPAEVEITGSFIEFLAPVRIDSKRFRGIKRWSLDADAEDEAMMALDACQ